MAWSPTRRVVALGAVILVAIGTWLTRAGDAWAGGMFLSTRGVRPTGRGGAFVAGADDLGALWYNPAGLVDLRGVSALIDVSLLFPHVRYTRVDSGNNLQPAVANQAPLTPVPTLGVSYDFRRKDLALAFGVVVPASPLLRFPEDGAQRYSLIGLDGTVLAFLELAVAWAPVRWLRLGVGLQDMMLHFKSTVALSACPSETVCAPEDPSFDSLAQVAVMKLWNPSAVFGTQVLLGPLRIGLALQLPIAVNADGTVIARLPSSAFFNGAHIEGDEVNVGFNLPLVLRGGVEWRAPHGLRFEAAVDWERWSTHQDIRITPRNVRIEDVPGIGTYELGEMRALQPFADIIAFHLGGEWTLLGGRLTLRAGYSFEQGVPRSALSVLSPDVPKHQIGIGASYRVGKFTFELSYAHFFGVNRTVSDTAVMQLNPIRPPVDVPVGNGFYEVGHDLLGLGVAASF